MASIIQDYLTRAELAADLNVCTRTIERWDRLGEGPPKTKIGNRILYRREGAAKWLRSREQDFEAA